MSKVRKLASGVLIAIRIAGCVVAIVVHGGSALKIIDASLTIVSARMMTGH